MPYFDFNATTPLHPAAFAAWRETTEQAWQNPSSPYRAAARAHALLEDARERLATLLGGDAEDYVFTSGATEANNAVFTHFARSAPATARVIVSAIEHPCVLEAAETWFPGRVTRLACNEQGVVRLEALDEALRTGGAAVVSLMAANNETGVLQPWREAQALCRARGAPFHCDAAQWLGKLPAETLADCDFLTGCAHKFGGPKGVGFLKVAASYAGFRGQRGGEQEHGRRGGTEDVPGIRTLVAALEAIAPRLAPEQAVWTEARARFEAGLANAVPDAVVVGADAPRLWNTTMFLAPRHENLRWVAALDRRGCQVSTGSACATGHDGPSHVLAALGVSPDAARRAVRVSAGWDTTPTEWQTLIEALREVWSDLEKEENNAGLVD